MDHFISLIEKSVHANPFFAVFLVYAAGVLTSFTPCVYPMIPITVGYIGARGASGRWNAFLLSFFYVAGMSVTYAALGIFAALTGSLFGSISTHPVSYLIVSAILIFLGLNMLGLFEINWPVFQVKSVKAGGFMGSFIVGMVSGLILSPCTAPVLAVLLGFVASTKKAMYGGLLMFVFALGMGTLIMIAGTFAGILSSLPKSGNWLNYTKKTFGLIMLILGGYLLVKTGMRFR